MHKTVLLPNADNGNDSHECFYRGIVDQMVDLVTITDSAGTVLFTNNANDRILGRPSYDRVGRSAFEFIHPSDVDRARDTFEEAGGGLHFVARRPPIRIRAIGLVWMCRDDVPEQHLVLDPELGQHAVDDRGACLRRAAPGQLALGGEGNPAHARAPIARGFPHEHDRCALARFQVGRQPCSPQARTAVLVERSSDPGPCELVYQCSQRTTSSSGSHGNLRRDEPRPSSGAAWPIVTTPTT